MVPQNVGVVVGTQHAGHVSKVSGVLEEGPCWSQTSVAKKGD